MGDMAVNVCERVLDLNLEPQLKPYIDLPHVAEIAQTMVKESLEAFVKEDTRLASKVMSDDEKVDHVTEQVFRELLTYMSEHLKTISRATRLLFIGKYLERLADHAVNIAELVIFLVDGKIIRHLKQPVRLLMRIAFGSLLLLLLVPCLLACNGQAEGASKARSTVTVAGSTSVMPFTEKLAEHFKIEHPRITVNVQGGGSSAGIQACVNGTVGIGMSSRELKGDGVDSEANGHMPRRDSHRR